MKPMIHPLATKEPREPRNFLEQHALKSLKAEPSWSITMYAVFNDLTDESMAQLREFLKLHLPENQWR